MARYKLLGGRHRVYDPATDTTRTYEKGDIVESNKDLCRLFRRKFELVSSATACASDTPPQDGEGSATATMVEPSPDQFVRYGEEVTHKFVNTNECRIFKLGRVYTVIDETSGRVLTTGLKTRPGVERWMRQMMDVED